MNYHTIIIGAGSGGLTAAIGLTGFGKRVALVEQKYVGGDCTNVGCIPSKVLIHEVNRLSGHTVDGAEILAKVRQKRDALRDEEQDYVQGIEKLDFIRGRATFEPRQGGQHTVRVALVEGGTQTLHAAHVVIATGSNPVRIPIEGLPPEHLLTNETLFEQLNVPKHLAIIGAGIIGTEMAFAFQKLGTQVSLIDVAPRVMGMMSEKASEVIQASMQQKGIAVYVGTKATHYRAEDQSLHLDTGVIAGVDKVLMAVGRAPNVAHLDLDQLKGLDYGHKGIVTGTYGATSVKGVYAIGDATPSSNFTHSANAQGRRLVMRLALPFLPRFRAEPAYPSATFSNPEVATVGLGADALSQRYHPKLIHRYHYELKHTDKGYTESLEQGFITIYAMRLTGRVLGAEVVAAKASEMVSLLTFAVHNRVSLRKLSMLVYPYPTLSEGIKKAADMFTLGTLPTMHKELGMYLLYRPLGLVRRLRDRVLKRT